MKPEVMGTQRAVDRPLPETILTMTLIRRKDSCTNIVRIYVLMVISDCMASCYAIAFQR